MDQAIVTNHIIAALVFSLLGVVLLSLSFVIFDKLTPGELWKEIVEKQNLPMAIVTGAFTLALAIIIAAAIHG